MNARQLGGPCFKERADAMNEWNPAMFRLEMLQNLLK